MFFYSDVDLMVKRSQEPMMNTMMVGLLGKRKFDTSDEDNKQEFGEYSGGSKKVRRVFKEPTDNMNLLELSHKKFSPESQKK